MKRITAKNLRKAVSTSLNGIVTGALCLASGFASAQDYPKSQIKIVVPWVAGGVTDASGRALAQQLSDRLSVPVVVENRPGAAGTIGARYVASAAADGYTLLLASGETHTIAPNLNSKLSYAPQKDFVPIMPFAISPFALVARKDFPANTLHEAIALVKKNPGRFNFASPGAGSTSQLAMESLKGISGMNIVHIPFQGQAPAMTALYGGQVDLQMLASGPSTTALQAGRLKVLAVATQERVAGMPDVPTFKELGIPSLSFANWFGIVAPAGLPAPVLGRLAAALTAVTKSAAMKTALQNLGVRDFDRTMTPAEFQQFIASEITRWGGVIRTANLKVE